METDLDRMYKERSLRIQIALIKRYQPKSLEEACGQLRRKAAVAFDGSMANWSKRDAGSVGLVLRELERLGRIRKPS